MLRGLRVPKNYLITLNPLKKKKRNFSWNLPQEECELMKCKAEHQLQNKAILSSAMGSYSNSSYLKKLVAIQKLKSLVQAQKSQKLLLRLYSFWMRILGYFILCRLNCLNNRIMTKMFNFSFAAISFVFHLSIKIQTQSNHVTFIITIFFLQTLF